MSNPALSHCLTSLQRFVIALPVKLQETDKIQHIVWSFGLILLFWPFFDLPWAMACVFVLGLLKEFWDEFFGSGFCAYDMAGNLVGIGVGSLLCLTPALFHLLQP